MPSEEKKETYAIIYAENSSASVVDGVTAEYMGRGWARGIEVPKAPCRFDLYFGLEGGKWVKVATSDKDGRVDFASKDIDHKLRAHLEDKLMRTVLPSIQCKQTLNLFRVPRIQIRFHQPPRSAYFLVKQYWFILVSKETGLPYHNTVFNANLIGHTEEELRKMAQKLIEETSIKLPHRALVPPKWAVNV